MTSMRQIEKRKEKPAKSAKILMIDSQEHEKTILGPNTAFMAHIWSELSSSENLNPNPSFAKNNEFLGWEEP